MKVTQITSQDVARSTTLEQSDVGKWAVIANGCYFIKPTKHEARELLDLLKQK